MDDKKKYKCLFNHELLILGTTQSPYQSYEENVSDAQAIGYIKELENTDVDVIMCCPTAWRCNLWKSKVDPHWEMEAPFEREPLPEHNWRYPEKAYYRLRRYMLAGGDPFGMSVKIAHECGKDIFASYRMNDNHYAWDKECPTHNTFFLEHDEWKMKTGYEFWSRKYCFSYKYEGVRQYYYSILKELVELYDVDGLELDFMRNPGYFDPEDIEDGILLMTDFVKSIRKMLNGFSEKRNKQLQLCVRIPHAFAQCKKEGLDVEAWDELGLIDMVNISPHYINTLYLEIEEFKKHIHNAALYGEMHFVLKNGKYDSGYEGLRQTSKTIYRTLAHNFMARGCDGISFFNFDYTRNHHFNESRREGLQGFEPPFDSLKNLNMDVLRNEPKHYFIHNYSPIANIENMAILTLNISEDTGNGIFKKAIARVETNDKCMELDIKMFLNGEELAETRWMGELFVPPSIEVLPAMDHVRYFDVPLVLIRQGNNTFEIQNVTQIKTRVKNIRFDVFELAIYTDTPLWE